MDTTTRKITTTETPIDPVTRGSDSTDLCKDGKFDAIFTSLFGSIYILKGNPMKFILSCSYISKYCSHCVLYTGSSYWKLGRNGLHPGYPKPISEKWIGLPSNIDAAFSSLSGKTYFFKGSKYWRYDGETMDKGFPNEISEGFEGIPNNIDAAMWVHHLNQGFFFKGENLSHNQPNLFS